LELPSPARAKFQSSVFTLASAVFDPFGQIVTAIIWPKAELWIFGRIFVVFVAGHRRRYVFQCNPIFSTTTAVQLRLSVASAWGLDRCGRPARPGWCRPPTDRLDAGHRYSVERKA